MEDLSLYLSNKLIYSFFKKRMTNTANKLQHFLEGIRLQAPHQLLLRSCSMARLSGGFRS